MCLLRYCLTNHKDSNVLKSVVVILHVSNPSKFRSFNVQKHWSRRVQKTSPLIIQRLQWFNRAVFGPRWWREPDEVGDSAVSLYGFCGHRAESTGESLLSGAAKTSVVLGPRRLLLPHSAGPYFTSALDRAGRLKEADYQWIVAKTDGNVEFGNLEASGIYAVETGLSAIEATFTTALSPHDIALHNATGAAETAYADLLATASAAFQTAIAGAAADFQTDQYAAQTAAMNSLATTLGTPWAQYQADLAASVESWWTTTQRPLYEALAADTAALQTAHQTAFNAEYTALRSAEATNDAAQSDALALARQAQSDSAAAAELAQRQAMLTATEANITGIALANRDNDLSLATAIRNLAFGDDGGQAYGQTEYNTALATAGSDQQSALTAAQQAYATEHAAHGATYRGSQTAGDTAYATSAGGALDTWTTNSAAAQYTFMVETAAADHALVDAATALNSAYETGEKASLATALTSLATASGTPWAQYTADQMGAAAQLEASRNTASDALGQARSAADEQKAVSNAGDLQVLGMAEAAAELEKLLGGTAAKGALSDGYSNAINDLDQAGHHDPTEPALPEPPDFADDLPTNPVNADDFTAGFSLAGGWETYLGPDDVLDTLIDDYLAALAVEGDQLRDGVRRGRVLQIGEEIIDPETGDLIESPPAELGDGTSQYAGEPAADSSAGSDTSYTEAVDRYFSGTTFTGFSNYDSVAAVWHDEADYNGLETSDLVQDAASNAGKFIYAQTGGMPVANRSKEPLSKAGSAAATASITPSTNSGDDTNGLLTRI